MKMVNKHIQLISHGLYGIACYRNNIQNYDLKNVTSISSYSSSS